MKNRLALALAAAGGYALGRVNKAALTSAVVTKRLDGLAGTLHERTAGLRDRLDANAPAPLRNALPGTGDGGGRTGKETDGKTTAAKSTAGNATKSTAKNTAKSTAESTPKKAAAKKPAARKSTAGKAPAGKTAAKRTGTKRASSAKTGRTSGSGGGGRG